MAEETIGTPQTQPIGSKSLDWPKIILAAALGLGLLATAAYAGYWYGAQQNQSVEELSAPTPTPTPRPNYAQGEVLVTFEDNTAYKQARDLFSSMGISEYSYAGPAEKAKVLMDDTLLQQIDLFKLKVPPGTENEIIEKLTQESIVRYANKNILYYPQ